MRFLLQDDRPRITLGSYRRLNRKEQKPNKPGSRKDDRKMVQHDPPTNPVSKFTRCPPGCDCAKCIIDRMATAALYAKYSDERAAGAKMSKSVRNGIRRRRLA